jgi:PAS domain S-box-containing protein
MTPPAENGLRSDRSRAQRTKSLLLLAAALAAGAVVFLAAHQATPLAAGAAAVVAVLMTGTLLARSLASLSRPVATLQRQLDHSRRGHEQLFSSIPSFICVLNREHHVIEANALYQQEFNVDDSHFCYEICKRRSKQCIDCLVDQTFEDGTSHSSEEMLVTRDGRRINVVVHTQPVYDEHGEITAVMEVFTDVTEVKRLQRQLALIGRAVAGMAHRVKNILMGLEGGIFVVNDALERDDREAVSQGWEMVERNVGLVSGIVKDLLYCSKDREPDFKPDVCPHDIAREVFELFSQRVENDDIEFKIELSDEKRCGTFDPEGLHNMLCNLVANAIDACRFDPFANKPGHHVTIRCVENGDGSTVLEVEDNGAGIPEDLNNKVFQDFFSSKGTEGTGIGLLVVQKVAEEHGGKVTFQSSPGVGTTFSVAIPRTDFDGRRPRQEESAHIAPA